MTKLVEKKGMETLEMLAEHMEKDPLPPERVELIKCELKQEFEEQMAFRSPLLRKRTSQVGSDLIPVSVKESKQGASSNGGDDVHSSIDEAMIGELSDQITALKELMEKKFEKSDISTHDKIKVLEAKLKKMIKESESAAKKSKDKNDKGIEKLGEAMSRVQSKVTQVSQSLKGLQNEIAALKALPPGQSLSAPPEGAPPAQAVSSEQAAAAIEPEQSDPNSPIVEIESQVS